MELILWRHADAEDPGPQGDLARELTQKGLRQAEAMADWLRPRLAGDWHVLSSPAVRARQTAAALGRDFEIRPKLDPASSAENYMHESGWPRGSNVILVGHQPTLGECVAGLLGDPAGDVAVTKGAIWWFAARHREGRLEAVVKAAMEPSMLSA